MRPRGLRIGPRRRVRDVEVLRCHSRADHAQECNEGQAIDDPVATDRHRIDNESRVELGVAALGELCCRCVDRAGHTRGVAADRKGVGIVAWLENHDSRIVPEDSGLKLYDPFPLRLILP